MKKLVTLSLLCIAAAIAGCKTEVSSRDTDGCMQAKHVKPSSSFSKMEYVWQDWVVSTNSVAK